MFCRNSRCPEKCAEAFSELFESFKKCIGQGVRTGASTRKYHYSTCVPAVASLGANDCAYFILLCVYANDGMNLHRYSGSIQNNA